MAQHFPRSYSDPNNRPRLTEVRPTPAIAKFDSQCRQRSRHTYLARQTEIVAELLPAFGIFAHGTPLATPSGTLAIEDVHLDDVLLGADDAPLTVIWIGEVTLAPGAVSQPWLRRILPDRFGFTRPASDLILGSGAEIKTDPLSTTGRMLDDYAGDDMIHPLTPPAPVRLFHVACHRPAPLLANGVSVMSFDAASFLARHNEGFRETFKPMMPAEAIPEDPVRPWLTQTPHRRVLGR